MFGHQLLRWLCRVGPRATAAGARGVAPTPRDRRRADPPDRLHHRSRAERDDVAPQPARTPSSRTAAPPMGSSSVARSATGDREPTTPMCASPVCRRRPMCSAGRRSSACTGCDTMDPEECVSRLHRLGVDDRLGPAGPCMPTWWRFLTYEDLDPAFEHYRRVVQLLLWKHPVEPGGFLVVKAPQIAARHIARFAEVFPEARFVITDRDPYRCVVSLAGAGTRHRRVVLRDQPADRRRASLEDHVRSGARQAVGHRRLHDARTLPGDARLVPRSSWALPSTSSAGSLAASPADDELATKVVA